MFLKNSKKGLALAPFYCHRPVKKVCFNRRKNLEIFNLTKKAFWNFQKYSINMDMYQGVLFHVINIGSARSRYALINFSTDNHSLVA